MIFEVLVLSGVGFVVYGLITKSVGYLILGSAASVLSAISVRMLAPTAFKIAHAKLTNRMILDIRTEAKRADFKPVKFESGFAVVDELARVPVDYEAVYYLDGVPVQTVWRSVGKGLRMEYMAFFKWMEETIGISVDEFENVMAIAESRGIRFKDFRQFLEFYNSLIVDAEQKEEVVRNEVVEQVESE